MGSYSADFPGSAGGGATIASNQIVQLEITAGNTTDDVTISSVDLTKSIVILLGSNASDPTDTSYRSEVYLQDATTVRAERTGTTGSCFVNAQVIEYNGGIASVQSLTGTTANDGNLFIDVTISSVDLAKSIIYLNGFTNTSGSGEAFAKPRLSFLNATTVRIEVTSTSAVTRARFMVVEFS